MYLALDTKFKRLFSRVYNAEIRCFSVINRIEKKKKKKCGCRLSTYKKMVCVQVRIVRIEPEVMKEGSELQKWSLHLFFLLRMKHLTVHFKVGVIQDITKLENFPLTKKNSSKHEENQTYYIWLICHFNYVGTVNV